MNNEGIALKARKMLDQLSVLLKRLTDQQYGTAVEHLNGSTIGEHTRHVLEMFDELLIGYTSGTVCYENRNRDMELQTVRISALARIDRIAGELNRENKDIVLTQSFIDGETSSYSLTTNYLREIVYNIEHTVHHLALIRVAIAELGLNQLIDPEFGYADSTILHKKQQESAR